MSNVVSDSVLARALTIQKDLSGASLAAKILIAHLRWEVSANPSTLATKAAELRAFFAQNAFAAKDIAVL
ncbi:hypothetical protein P775_21315 [Puniceibacterium antarcticum]|uniref:Uncharacterized protein n=1 Tax=Puniceibacterium antarcticum TaxID=1206336 RepID=A0A2G8R9A7_9RHOB|nr:hypothetical protein [Puniceibacterium antarcticum]PIL18112.1 hypothetical protein P775_21315 [Puniceibacterium antarcticum]